MYFYQLKRNFIPEKYLDLAYDSDILIDEKDTLQEPCCAKMLDKCSYQKIIQY